LVTVKKEYLSQDRIVNTLNSEGYDISSRTLGFWRSEGIIPPMFRDGNEYYYDLTFTPDILDQIRFLSNGKRRLKPISLTTILLEGELFTIETIEIIRTPTGLKAAFHLRDGGRLVRDIEEELLDAITRAD